MPKEITGYNTLQRRPTFAMYYGTVGTGNTPGQRMKMNFMSSFGHPIKNDETFDYVEVKGTSSMYPNSDFCFSFGPQFGEVANRRGKLRQSLGKHYTKQKYGGIFYFDADPLKMYDIPNVLPRVRIAYGSIWPDKAEYFLKGNASRWDKIKSQKNIVLKDYNYSNQGEFIYICCNRGSGGYSAKGKNACEWAIETTNELRKYTARPIIIRQHSSTSYASYSDDFYKLQKFARENSNVKIESPSDIGNYPNIIEQTKKAHSVIVYTSTAGVSAIVEGKPLYVLGNWSYLYSMNHGDLSEIENPNLNMHSQRERFFDYYSRCHFNKNELRKGLYWNRIRGRLLSEWKKL